MKKYTISNLWLTACLVLTLCACQKKDNSVAEPSGNGLENITDPIAKLLNSSRENWNRYAAGHAEMMSYKLVGSIRSEVAKQSLIASLADDNSYVAYGNLLEPGALHLLTVKELTSASPSLRDSLIEYSSKQIAVGDKIIEITWKSKAGSFTTQCVANNSDIVWDNILTNVILVDPQPAVENTTGVVQPDNGTGTMAKTYAAWYKVKNTWTGNWIWGGKRGDMGEEITIYCYSNGHVYNTDNRDWANMTLGSAKSESKVLVNSGTYGKIQYALGISTPFASVSFNSGKFKVEVSGIGSSMVQNGSHSQTPW